VLSEHSLSLSALPYVCGAAANLLGGLACDWLASRVGVTWSRRGVGIAGSSLAAISIACAFFTANHVGVIVCLSLAYAGITFQQPAVFASCIDIGGTRGGAVTGMMNTTSQLGGALSSVAFGYIVKASGSYDAPLIPMAALLVIAAILWRKVEFSAAMVVSPEPAHQSV